MAGSRGGESDGDDFGEVSRAWLATSVRARDGGRPLEGVVRRDLYSKDASRAAV